MKRAFIRVAEVLIVAGVIVVLIYLALRPEPVQVETARAEKGAMNVTVDGEGKTRVLDRYIVAAPVTGKLSRIKLERGDSISEGAIITRIDPLPLTPLDTRQRTEADARVRAATAAKREAEANAEHARVHFEQAKRERERAEKLFADGIISRQEMERAREDETTSAEDLKAARFKVQTAVQEVEVARSALLTTDSSKQIKQVAVSVTSPVNGKVLRVLEESERVVQAGTPLVEISNPSNLEIVVDVLSTDAVKIQPGAAVSIENWGGEKPLQARVRYIEPSAFTKISALGIEEQRVNVIADFTGDVGSLGDGFRVEARIVVWESASVLKIPSSAIFRKGEKWNVFTVENGVATTHEVEVGHRTDFEVEILQGLNDGAQIILHPANEIADNSSVKTE